jgi:hypothetical protein
MKNREKTDRVEKPLVFLGGTCANSTWRDKLIPSIQGFSEPFNPVVENWDAEAFANEERMKAKADIRLYVITPDSHSRYSIAEAVSDSIKYPLKTVFCYTRDKEASWKYASEFGPANLSSAGPDLTPDEIKSLDTIGNMIEENGGTFVKSLLDIVTVIETWNDRIEAANQTLDHMNRVDELCCKMAGEMIERGFVHDDSKMKGPEWPSFRENTITLKDLTYNSPEYKKSLADMKPAIDHHYSKNTHHPEYWENGVDDMCLLDLVEMLCDWKAATERHEDGDLNKSLEINKKRFKITPQLESIFKNTIEKYLT